MPGDLVAFVRTTTNSRIVVVPGLSELACYAKSNEKLVSALLGITYGLPGEGPLVLFLKIGSFCSCAYVDLCSSNNHIIIFSTKIGLRLLQGVARYPAPCLF